MSREKLQRGAAFALFSSKYAPEANKESFELVAQAYLRRNGHPDADLNDLLPEQETLLLSLFERLSKEALSEWIAGLLLREYFEKDTQKLRQEVEAAKARRKQKAD